MNLLVQSFLCAAVAALTLSACVQPSGGGASGASVAGEAAPNESTCVDGIAVERLKATVTETKKGDLTVVDYPALAERYFGFAEAYRVANPELAAALAQVGALWAEAGKLWDAGGGGDLTLAFDESEEEFRRSMQLQEDALAKMSQANALLSGWQTTMDSIPYC